MTVPEATRNLDTSKGAVKSRTSGSCGLGYRRDVLWRFMTIHKCQYLFFEFIVHITTCIFARILARPRSIAWL
jgi:hypothetical protein